MKIVLPEIRAVLKELEVPWVEPTLENINKFSANTFVNQYLMTCVIFLALSVQGMGKRP